MPTVLRIRGYNFIVFTNDHPPAHVHVRKGDGSAKVDLHSVQVLVYHNLNTRELSEIEALTKEHRTFLQAKWDEIHGDNDGS